MESNHFSCVFAEMADTGRMSVALQALIWRWVVLMLAVWVASAIVPGIAYAGWQQLAIAALVLGLLNAFLKPLLMVVSAPAILITFGLFMLGINAALLRMTAWLVDGFTVAGWWPALGGSLIVSLVSLFFKTGRPPRVRVVPRPPEPFGPVSRPPPGKGPIIDI